MKKNILKSNSSFVVIGKSPAWLQNNFESGRIFSLAQTVNFDFSSNRQASKQLGYQNYSSNIDYRTPEVNLSIDYYFSPSLNNELLMGFKESSGSNATSFSGFKNNNYNFYFFSNENESADGFDEVKKPANLQNWSEGEVISFGNCYLTNYSLSLGLGQVPVISTKFKSSNIAAETLNSGGSTKTYVQIPSLDPYSGKLANANYNYTGLQFTGGNIIYDWEARSDLNPPIALPYKSSVSIINQSVDDSQLTPLKNFSNLILQSCNLSFDFNRVDLYKFGNDSVCDRKLQFPINANIQIESLVSGFNANESNTQNKLGSATLNNKENIYDIEFIFKNDIETSTGVYNFQGAKLTSLNYSTQINNIYKMSASFSVEITENKGFIMTSNAFIKEPLLYFDTNYNLWQSEPSNWNFS
jgi:hypothetical protein